MPLFPIPTRMAVAELQHALPAYFIRAEELADKLRRQGESLKFETPQGTPLNRYGQDRRGPHLATEPLASACARCNTFLTLLLESTRPGWSPKRAGMSSDNPSAAMYHDAIEGGRAGFRKVIDFETVMPGDILAAKYHDPSRDTGHIMLVRSFRQGGPDANGISRWEVEVIDCSGSIHSDDMRVFPSRTTTGVGCGKIGVYTRSGKIVGYTWSLKKGSPVILPRVRDLTLGRITR